LRDGVPTVVDASTVMGTEIIQALAPVPQAAGQIGEQIPATMAEGIRDGTGEVVDSIENMVDKAMDAFGAGDFEGVRDAFNLKLPPLLGRASGGPMTAGRPYLVGERGPELVIPGRNSWVVPNGSMGGSGGGNSGPITLNFYGDRNPQETARLVRDELIKINRNNAGRVL
jgi:SLT domain-containing protein